MKKITLFILLSAAAAFFAACGAPAANTGANNANTSTTKPVAPTADALMALDKQANEAYVKGDSKFFEGMLSDKFVILTGGGQRIDKAATVKMIASVKCDIKSMDLTEPAMSMIDADTYASAIRPLGTARATAPKASVRRCRARSVRPASGSAAATNGRRSSTVRI
jgi:hypothetical protein